MTRVRALLAVAVAAAVLAGCATRQGIRDDYDKAQKDYNEIMRWKGLDAGAAFAAADVRAGYRERAKAAKDIRVTEYRVLDVQYDPDKREARVQVEYQYYRTSSNRMDTVIDEQIWSYREEEGGPIWRLTSLPPAFK